MRTSFLFLIELAKELTLKKHHFIDILLPSKKIHLQFT
jgi:hypothetical protein